MLLMGRHHPEFAPTLRDEAYQLRCTILDTTHLSLEDCAQQIWTQFSHECSGASGRRWVVAPTNRRRVVGIDPAPADALARCLRARS